jgi:hypothetical protein
MQQIELEPQITITLAIAAESAWPKSPHTSIEEDCKVASNGAGSCYCVQCFTCSRIYFDQKLSRCPRCNSDSLQHYTTADLNYFARDRVGDSFEAGAVIHDQQ